MKTSDLGFQEQYRALAHAIQSALAYMEGHGDKAFTPKHLRVGIDTAKAEQGALIQLLVRKGIVTDEEVAEALLEGLRQELEMQTARARRDYGLPPQASFA